MDLLIALLMGVLVLVPVMWVLYLVIRAGVRDGMIAAHYRFDRDRVRSELGIGTERSPNSRRTNR